MRMKFRKNVIDRIISTRLKEIASNSDFRKKEANIFLRKADFFLSIFICETGINNNIVMAASSFKPMFMDELFWDIMGMNSNSKSPLSLRATGAFTITGLTIFERRVEITDISEVSGVVDEMVDKSYLEFITVLESLSYECDNFIKLAESQNDVHYDMELGKILFSIKNNDYKGAYNIAQKAIILGRKGHFANEGKYIYERVVEYCMKKM